MSWRRDRGEESELEVEGESVFSPKPRVGIDRQYCYHQPVPSVRFEKKREQLNK